MDYDFKRELRARLSNIELKIDKLFDLITEETEEEDLLKEEEEEPNVKPREREE